MPKEFEFVSGEKTYKLVLDLNAQCLFDEMAGKSFYEVATDKTYMATATEQRILIYAMLKCYQPEITLEEAGALVSNLAEIPIIRESMLRSQPEPTGEETGSEVPSEPTG